MAGKKVGVVTHYYSGIGVGIVNLGAVLSVGDNIQIKGSTTDIKQKVNDMQFDHQNIKSGKKGQEVGIKVNDKVRGGDQVFVI